MFSGMSELWGVTIVQKSKACG